MGASKTSAMIEYMNKRSAFQKFIFVTPFLSEVERIKEYCGFVEPKEDEKNRSKCESFKNLILSKQNIVTTHALFKHIDLEVVEILKDSGYILVLDEVLDVVSETTLTQIDIEALISLGILKRTDNGNIEGGDEAVLKKYSGDWEYDNIVNNLLRHTLEFFGKEDDEKVALMWLFPIDLLQTFKDIYILTYCFDGYPLKSYLDLYNMKQEKYSVEIINPEAEYIDRQYRFIPYVKRSNKDIKSKIEILDGTVLNNIGEPKMSCTVTWYGRRFSNSNNSVQMRKNLLNVVRNRFNNRKQEDIMWTCFKKDSTALYNDMLVESNFVQHNARATNAYMKKTSLVYLVNRFYNPIIKRWFRTKGINVNEDVFSLGEMTQWIFRSAIRNGEKIQIYIPSKRMRDILELWLNID